MSDSENDTHPVVTKMLRGDRMTDWLKAEVLESRPGFCRLSMIAREEMANGFGIIHGSITFALADSAIAFAANAHGTCLSASRRRPVAAVDPRRTRILLRPP